MHLEARFISDDRDERAVCAWRCKVKDHSWRSQQELVSTSPETHSAGYWKIGKHGGVHWCGKTHSNLADQEIAPRPLALRDTQRPRLTPGEAPVQSPVFMPDQKWSREEKHAASEEQALFGLIDCENPKKYEKRHAARSTARHTSRAKK